MKDHILFKYQDTLWKLNDLRKSIKIFHLRYLIF